MSDYVERLIASARADVSDDSRPAVSEKQEEALEKPRSPPAEPTVNCLTDEGIDLGGFAFLAGRLTEMRPMRSNGRRKCDLDGSVGGD